MSDEIPVSFQLEVLGPQLNGTILYAVFFGELGDNLNHVRSQTFLGTGIYTVVFVGTIYLYAVQKQKQSHVIVTATLSVLYAITFVLLALQWQMTTRAFIDNGDTRFSSFISLQTTNFGVEMAINILTNLSYLLADALLLWRCYNIVQGSLRWMCVPFLLYILEIGLFFGSIIVDWIAEDGVGFVSPSLAQAVNATSGGLAAATAATSLVATCIICRKIYVSIKNIQRGSLSTKRFSNILQIVLQSAAIYSAVVLVQAIVTIVQATLPANHDTIFVIAEYSVTFTILATGIAPTLMVTQLALSRTNTPSTRITENNRMTTLQFNGVDTVPRESETDVEHGASQSSNYMNYEEKRSE